MHAPVCFREAAWSLPHGLPSLVVSKGGAAIADPCCTLILHCYCIPPSCRWGLLPCLPFIHAACTYCPCYCVPVLQAGPPTHMAHGIAFDYCRPVSQWDCLPTLAFHVNVYALISLPPWSILSLFQPPLQRSPSVVTVVTLASTYCSFPMCGDRQEFRESPFLRPERASLSFAFLLYLPPLWRAARSRSKSSVGDPVIICLLFHLPTLMARGPSGPAYHCLSAQFAPVMACGPSSERALRRQPSYHLPFVSFAHLYGSRPGRASFSLPFCPIFPRYGARLERASLSLPSAQFAPVMAGARPVLGASAP